MEPDESFLLVLNTTLTSRTVSLNPGYAFVTIANDDRKLYVLMDIIVWMAMGVGARIRRMVQEKDILFGGLARGLIGVWVGGWVGEGGGCHECNYMQHLYYVCFILRTTVVL